MVGGIVRAACLLDYVFVEAGFHSSRCIWNAFESLQDRDRDRINTAGTLHNYSFACWGITACLGRSKLAGAAGGRSINVLLEQP